MILIPHAHDCWTMPLLAQLIACGMAWFHGGYQTVLLVGLIGGFAAFFLLAPISLVLLLVTHFFPRWRSIWLILGSSMLPWLTYDFIAHWLPRA